MRRPRLRRFIVTIPPDNSIPPVPGGYYLDIYAKHLAAAQAAADRVAPGAWGFCHRAEDLTRKDLAAICPKGLWATIR